MGRRQYSTMSTTSRKKVETKKLKTIAPKCVRGTARDPVPHLVLCLSSLSKLVGYPIKADGWLGITWIDWTEEEHNPRNK